MRLTINLEPDVYSFASAYAGGRGISLSSAISELVRRAEGAPEPEAQPKRLKRNEYGYLEIARTDNVLTPEMVGEAAEDALF